MQNITIGGKRYPVKFNWTAVKTYEKETGESYYEAIGNIAGESPKLTALVGLIYAGIVGAGMKIDPETILPDVLKLKPEEITAITLLYLDSLPKPEPVDATKAPDPITDEGPGEPIGQPSRDGLA